MCYHSYVESKKKKKIQMNLFTKQKQTHRHRNNLTVTKRGNGAGGRINYEFGISRYILLYKLDNNRILLYSTGNCI